MHQVFKNKLTKRKGDMSLSKEWMRNAYQSENPSLTLLQYMNRLDNVKISMLTQLFSGIHASAQSGDSDNPGILSDIESMREQLTKPGGKPTRQSLESMICYVATAMTHIWGDMSNQIDQDRSIFTYVKPNRPIPYIWFNARESLDTKLELIKHTMGYDVIDVIVHVVPSPGQLVTLKLSYDMETGDALAAVQGNFMQIAVREDEKTVEMKRIRKGAEDDSFVVILTYEMIIQGVFHNNCKDSTVDPCVYAIHYV